MAKVWNLQARQSPKDKKWYVTLSGGNGEKILRSKGYPSREQAESLCKDVQAAEIDVVMSGTSTGWYVGPHKSEKDKLWYNRLVSPAGELMWSEGYARSDSAQRACRKLKSAMVVTLHSVSLK